MNSLKVAEKQTAVQNHDAWMKYLTFQLGDELYAVNIMTVREIIEYGDVTPMPMMPEFICGAINLRGHAVPVIDLAKRMGKGQAEIFGRACIIIVEMHYDDLAMDVGVIVDAVSRVIDLKASDIDKTPTFGGNIRVDFISGLGKVDDKFIIMLEIERVLCMDDLKALSQMGD